jgi:hypothetical protein
MSAPYSPRSKSRTQSMIAYLRRTYISLPEYRLSTVLSTRTARDVGLGLGYVLLLTPRPLVCHSLSALISKQIARKTRSQKVELQRTLSLPIVCKKFCRDVRRRRSRDSRSWREISWREDLVQSDGNGACGTGLSNRLGGPEGREWGYFRLLGLGN